MMYGCVNMLAIDWSEIVFKIFVAGTHIHSFYILIHILYLDIFDNYIDIDYKYIHIYLNVCQHKNVENYTTYEIVIYIYKIIVK